MPLSHTQLYKPPHVLAIFRLEEFSVSNIEHVKAISSDQNNKGYHKKHVICGETLQPTHSVSPQYSAAPVDGTILL